jgi:hypothetical protein
MPRYEYKVVAAPRKGLKAKTARTSEDRFAHALATVMNDQAKDGWEYLRTDTLPCEERKGLTGRTTVYQNMLVFRREVAAAAAPEGPSVKVTAVTGPAALPASAPVPRLVAPVRNGVEDDDTPIPPLGPAIAPKDAKGSAEA